MGRKVQQSTEETLQRTVAEILGTALTQRATLAPLSHTTLTCSGICVGYLRHSLIALQIPSFNSPIKSDSRLIITVAWKENMCMEDRFKRPALID